MNTQPLRSKVEAVSVAVLLLWFISAAGVVRVGAAMASGLLSPVNVPYYRFEADPTFAWSLQAAIGALVGMSLGFSGYWFRPSLTPYRPALTVIAMSSLSGMNDRFFFGDAAGLFAALGAPANARSLCYSAFALGIVCVVAAIDAARQQRSRWLTLWFGATGIVAFGFGVHAALIHATLPGWPLSIDGQLLLGASLLDKAALLLAGVAVTVVFMLVERYVRVLAIAVHGVVFLLVLGGVSYWGREALVPITPVTSLSVAWVGPAPTTPWLISLTPLAAPGAARRVVYMETEVYFEGVPLCSHTDCTTELREKFSEHREREITRGRGPRIEVFASASTPLRVLERTVIEARSEELAVDLGVVRTARRVRPVVGPIVSFEAGVLPGAADIVLSARNDKGTWGEWLSAHLGAEK